MIEEAARALEEEFERVALGPIRNIGAKRHELSILIHRMFDEAVAGIWDNTESAALRVGYVTDYFVRDDLGPKVLEDAFNEKNVFGRRIVDELLYIAQGRIREVEAYVPDIPTTLQV